MAFAPPPLMCHTRHISGGVQNPCMKKKKRKSQLAQVAGGDIHNASTTRSTIVGRNILPQREQAVEELQAKGIVKWQHDAARQEKKKEEEEEEEE